MQETLEFDENCDPNHPRKIKYDDILAASRRIIGSVLRTPCTKAHTSGKLGMEVYLKQEFLQQTGCFKERGIRNMLLMLDEEQKKRGVISASNGNHGVAMSYQCTLLGVPCVIVMPHSVAINKIEKCEKIGAKLIIHGTDFQEAKTHAMNLSKDKKMIYINGYDHPNIIEGQGSIGIEIIEQVPAVDAILIPVGGGSLLTGVAIAAKHLKPDTEIYGVTTDKTCAMVEAFRKNERVNISIESTIADALNVSIVGVNTFHTLKGVVDKMVVVKEDWVARAIMHLVEDEKYVVEGAGAVPFAAILAGLFPNLKGKKVVCICSGGNIGPTALARAMERGMAAEGRLVEFKVSVRDRPGGMAELCTLLAGIGVTVRDCVPERSWVKGDVFGLELRVICETRGWDHTKDLMQQVKKHYKDHVFQDTSDHTNRNSNARRGPCLAPSPVCMQK